MHMGSHFTKESCVYTGPCEEGTANNTHHMGGPIAQIATNAGDAAITDNEFKAKALEEEATRKSVKLAEKMMGDASGAEVGGRC